MEIDVSKAIWGLVCYVAGVGIGWLWGWSVANRQHANEKWEFVDLGGGDGCMKTTQPLSEEEKSQMLAAFKGKLGDPEFREAPNRKISDSD